MPSTGRRARWRSGDLPDRRDAQIARLKDHFIIAGFGRVGKEVARQLAIRFGSLEALTTASEEHLTSVRDIGAEVAHSIREYFDEPRNLKAVKRLEKELDIEVIAGKTIKVDKW